jgi:hypothetical protein
MKTRVASSSVAIGQCQQGGGQSKLLNSTDNELHLVCGPILSKDNAIILCSNEATQSDPLEVL